MLARCGWGSLSTLSKQLSHLRLQESTEFLRRLQRNFSEAAEQDLLPEDADLSPGDRDFLERPETEFAITQPLAGSCLLERLPVVTPEDLPFQKEYYEWQYKLMRKYRKELPKEFQESEAKKAENASTSGWQPAPRVTEADRSNDTKSLERKLDRRLFLLLKRKGGTDGVWELPTTLYQGDGDIRSTAMRALEENADGTPDCKVFFVGNAPCGHWEDSEGLPHFINKAQLIKGAISLAEGSQYYDHAWLCREEVLERVQEPSLRNLFDRLLPRLV